MKKTKIFIADDHRVVIEGIKSTLSECPDFDVVGEALNGRDAVRLVKALVPDIIIMDISMPDLNGIDATMQIRKINPDVRIIIYTMYADREYVLDLLRAGISGYVLKESPVADLILAIQAAKGGGSYFITTAPMILSQQMELFEEEGNPTDEIESLSIREREVFQLLAEGKAAKEIAAKLSIDAKTVQTHKYNIFRKLKVNNLTELTKLAVRRKLIHL
jgi:DNA-binding NarL/FixJ family response regulator